MAWMPVDQFVGSHEKTLELARRRNWTARYTVGLLVDVWGWAIDHCPHGYIDGDTVSPGTGTTVSPGTDESAEPARDRRGSLAKALRMSREELADLLRDLREVGWIDPDGRLHEWDEWGGKIVARREYERDKKRRARANKAETQAPSLGTTQPRPSGQRVVVVRPEDWPRQPVEEPLSPGTSRTKTRQDEIRTPLPRSSGTEREDAGVWRARQQAELERLKAEQAAQTTQAADAIVAGAEGVWAKALAVLRGEWEERQRLVVFTIRYRDTRLIELGEHRYQLEVPDGLVFGLIRNHGIDEVRAAIGAVTECLEPEVEVVVRAKEAAG